MPSIAEAYMRLRVDPSQIKKDTEKGVQSAAAGSGVGKAGTKAGQSFSRSMGTHLKSFAGGIGGIFAAIGVGAIVKEAVNGGLKLQRSTVILEAAERAHGISVKGTAGALKGAVEQGQKYGVTQDVIQNGLTKLLNAGVPYNEALKIQQAALNVSAVTGQDYSSVLQKLTMGGGTAARTLKALGVTQVSGATQAKALSNAHKLLTDRIQSAGGIAGFAKQQHISLAQAHKLVSGALGGNISDYNKLNIEVLPKSATLSQNLAQAQAILNNKYGKEGKAATQTFSGQMKSLTANLKDTAAQIGVRVLPFVTGLLQTFTKLPGPVKTVIIVLGLLAGVLTLISATPFIAIAGGIALAALLIIRYWKPIVGFFKGIFAKLEAFGRLTPLGFLIRGIIAGVELIVNHWRGIVGFFVGIWHGIHDFFIAPLVNFFTKTIPHAVGVVLDWLKHNWPILLSILAGPFAPIVALVIKFHSQIWGIFKTIWSAIRGFLIAVWNGIKAAASAVFNTIKNIVLGVWNALWSAARTIWNAVWNFFKSVWGGIQRTASVIWNTVKAIVVGVWNALWTAARTIWNAVSGFFRSMWTGIQRIGSTIWNTIKGIVIGVWNALWTAARNIWNAVWNFFKVMWTGIQRAASTIWNTIKGIVLGVWNALWGAARTIWNAVSKFFHDLWTGIQRTANSIWNTIKGIIVGVWNWLQRTAKSVWNITKGIIAGVWNGIKAAASTIWNAIKTTIKNIWDGIKKIVRDPIVVAVKVINTLVDGVDAVLGFLHIPKIPHIPPVPGFASGGKVNWGTGETSDDVLARVSRNETIVSAAHSRRLAPYFAAVGVPGYAGGGVPNTSLPPTFAGFGSSYVNPLGAGHFQPQRIDQGVDYAAIGHAQPLLALGAGTILGNTNPGWPAGNFWTLRLAEGIFANAVIFYAEHIRSLVHKGQKVNKGQHIFDLLPGSPNLEIGFADSAGSNALAKQTGGYREGQRTAVGDLFNNVLVALGAPSGLAGGRPISGNLGNLPHDTAGGWSGFLKFLKSVGGGALGLVINGVEDLLGLAGFPKPLLDAINSILHIKGPNTTGHGGIDTIISGIFGKVSGGAINWIKTKGFDLLKNNSVIGGLISAASAAFGGGGGGAIGPVGHIGDKTSWAKQLLNALHIAVKGDNVKGLVHWATLEGGHWNNAAKFNPLNTTMGGPGVVNGRGFGVGIKAYDNWQHGIQATVATLTHYSGILNALKSGNYAALGSAILHSPWGTVQWQHGGNIREPIRGIGLNTGRGYLMGEKGNERVVPGGSDPLLDEIRRLNRNLEDIPARTAAGVARAIKAPAGQEATAARIGARG